MTRRGSLVMGGGGGGNEMKWNDEAGVVEDERGGWGRYEATKTDSFCMGILRARRHFSFIFGLGIIFPCRIGKSFLSPLCMES